MPSRQRFNCRRELWIWMFFRKMFGILGTDEEESILQRVGKLIFGTWLTFGTIVFSIIVAIVSLSLILVSFITYKVFKRRGLIKK